MRLKKEDGWANRDENGDDNDEKTAIKITNI